MKKIALFIGFAFIAFAINAQEIKPESAAIENPNAPEIKFNKTIHDYGTIANGADGKCEFKFTNTGKEPLIIENVRSSCGCTVPKWPREPILAGKTESIEVSYDTKRTGPINKQITVTSNAKTATVVLSIKGTIEPKPAESAPEKPATGITPQAH